MYLNFALWGDGFWNDHHSLLQKAYVVEYSSDAVQTEGRSWSEVKSMFR